MAETNYIGDVRVVEDVAAATNYIGDVRAFDTAAECENFIGYVDGVDDPATSKNYIGDVRVVTDIADVTNYIGDVHSWSTLNYEPEILTYIAGLTTPLSSKQKTDLNTFVKTIKNEIGITALSQIADAVHILSAETGEASLRNIVRNKHYGTLINNPAHTPYEGFKGNGTSQCIDIDFIPARDGVTYALNSASIGVYSRTNDASANFVDIGVIDGNNSAYLSYIFAGTCYASINSVIGAGSFTGLNPTTGLFMRVRSDNSIVHAYISNDEVSIANPVPSFALSTLKIFLLAAGGAGNAPSSFSKRQLALSWIGRALTRTEQIIVNTVFETYLESNGKYRMYNRRNNRMRTIHTPACTYLP